MAINISRLKESKILELGDLLKQKQAMIDAMKRDVERLNDGGIFEVKTSLFGSVSGPNLPDRASTKHLEDALSCRAEWIVDSVYDLAISNIENNISVLAEEVMNNLIEAYEEEIPY